MPPIESLSSKRANPHMGNLDRSGTAIEAPDRSACVPSPIGLNSRRALRLPEWSLAARPGLLVLTTLLLLGLFAILIFRPGSPRSTSSGNDLLAANSVPKLKESGANAAPAWVRHANVEIVTAQSREPGVGRSQELVQVAAPAPPLLPVPDVPSSPALKETVQEETEPIRTPQRGETPMIRNWKLMGLQLVLGGLLAAPHAVADDAK